MKRAVVAAGLLIAAGVSTSHAATVQFTGCGLGPFACFGAGYLSGVPIGIASREGLPILGGNGWEDRAPTLAAGSAKPKKTAAAASRSKAVKSSSAVNKNAKSKTTTAATSRTKAVKSNAPVNKSAKPGAKVSSANKVVVTLPQSGLLGMAIADQFAKTLFPKPESPPGQSDHVPSAPVVVQVPELDRPRKDHPESNVVPIPPAAALFLTGFGMLAAWSRRRRTAA